MSRFYWQIVKTAFLKSGLKLLFPTVFEKIDTLLKIFFLARFIMFLCLIPPKCLRQYRLSLDSWKTY